MKKKSKPLAIADERPVVENIWLADDSCRFCGSVHSGDDACDLALKSIEACDVL